MIPTLLCTLFVYLVVRSVARFAEVDSDIATKESAREQRGTAR